MPLGTQFTSFIDIITSNLEQDFENMEMLQVCLRFPTFFFVLTSDLFLAFFFSSSSQVHRSDDSEEAQGHTQVSRAPHHGSHSFSSFILTHRSSCRC